MWERSTVVRISERVFIDRFLTYGCNPFTPFPVILGKAVYLLLLLVGSLGFLAMTLLGFMHGGGARMHHAAVGHAHAGSHTGGAHAGTHSGSHSGGRTSAPSGKSSGGRSRNFPAWLMISPMDIFAFSLGAGAAGSAGSHQTSTIKTDIIMVISTMKLCQRGSSSDTGLKKLLNVSCCADTVVVGC